MHVLSVQHTQSRSVLIACALGGVLPMSPTPTYTADLTLLLQTCWPGALLACWC